MVDKIRINASTGETISLALTAGEDAQRDVDALNAAAAQEIETLALEEKEARELAIEAVLMSEDKKNDAPQDVQDYIAKKNRKLKI
jgi:hypothetical protein